MSGHSRSSHRHPHEYRVPSSHGSSRYSSSEKSFHPQDYPLPPSHVGSRHGSNHSPAHSSHHSNQSRHASDLGAWYGPPSSHHGSHQGSHHGSSHHTPSHHSNHSHHSNAVAPAVPQSEHHSSRHSSRGRHSQFDVSSMSSSVRNPRSVGSFSSDNPGRNPGRKLFQDWFSGSSPYTSLEATPARCNNRKRTTPGLYIQSDWDTAIQESRRDARDGLIPKQKYMVKNKDGKSWSAKWL